MEPLHGHYDTVFAIGYPYVRSAISGQIRQEQGDLFPLAVGALLLTLFLLLRQLVDVLAPLLTALISIAWTLGLMGLSGIPLNMVTSIVPILLIVVGSTEDIHLLSEFRRAQREGNATAPALDLMALRMGRTVLLTFLTTYVGFLSVGLSRIEVLWQFAIPASNGLLFNFLATVTLIPALLSLTGDRQLDGRPRPAVRAGEGAASRYWRWLYRNRRGVLLLLAAAVTGAAGLPGLQVNHSMTDSLARGSGVRAQVEAVNQRLAGLETFSVMIDSGIQDTFLKVRYLEEIQGKRPMIGPIAPQIGPCQ